MTINLDMALKAARQFGAEAAANNLPSWTKDDRENIAYHYGVENWPGVSDEHRALLLKAYRGGERIEKKLIREDWNWRNAYENSRGENEK